MIIIQVLRLGGPNFFGDTRCMVQWVYRGEYHLSMPVVIKIVPPTEATISVFRIS